MINIDKIVTISLQDREDRRAIVKTELSKLNLKSEFFLVDRDKENVERGCFNSHVRVSQEALNKGCKSLLIFEDDVKILPYSQKQIERLNRFLKQSQRFELIYLGLMLGKMWHCGLSSIVRARGACTHAYILSSSGLEKMATLQYNGTAIDQIIKRQFKCYSIYPMIAEQYPETVMPSDISAVRFQRGKHAFKDEQFWKQNYAKQKGSLWKNFHRTIKELMND